MTIIEYGGVEEEEEEDKRNTKHRETSTPPTLVYVAVVYYNPSPLTSQFNNKEQLSLSSLSIYNTAKRGLQNPIFMGSLCSEKAQRGIITSRTKCCSN